MSQTSESIQVQNNDALERVAAILRHILNLNNITMFAALACPVLRESWMEVTPHNAPKQKKNRWMKPSSVHREKASSLSNTAYRWRWKKKENEIYRSIHSCFEETRRRHRHAVLACVWASRHFPTVTPLSGSTRKWLGVVVAFQKFGLHIQEVPVDGAMCFWWYGSSIQEILYSIWRR